MSVQYVWFVILASWVVPFVTVTIPYCIISYPLLLMHMMNYIISLFVVQNQNCFPILYHHLYFIIYITSESSISPHILSFPWLSQTLRSSVASSRGLLLCGSLGGDLCRGAKKMASEHVEKGPWPWNTMTWKNWNWQEWNYHSVFSAFKIGFRLKNMGIHLLFWACGVEGYRLGICGIRMVGGNRPRILKQLAFL